MFVTATPVHPDGITAMDHVVTGLPHKPTPRAGGSIQERWDRALRHDDGPMGRHQLLFGDTGSDCLDHTLKRVFIDSGGVAEKADFLRRLHRTDEPKQFAPVLQLQIRKLGGQSLTGHGANPLRVKGHYSFGKVSVL